MDGYPTINDSFLHPGRSLPVASPAYVHTGLAGKRLRTQALARRLLLESLFLIVTASVIFFILYFGEASLSAQDHGPIISYGINVSREPVQKETAPFQSTMSFNGAVARLSSNASYAINGKVQGIMPYDDTISEVAPYDLLLAWGEVADDGVGSGLSWQQSDRKGQVSGTIGREHGTGINSSYVISHVSNNHVIPANDDIRVALGRIKPGDIVRIEGRLVDLRLLTGGNQTITVFTSKNRFDQGDGACEVIYVERLQVNDLSY